MILKNNKKEDFILKAISLDTGGTMTDSFIIDSEGSFTIGKAQTTPYNEIEGIINSINDALSLYKTTLDEAGKSVEALVYSGTAMLNRLLEREGNSNIGIIVNAGFEDLLRLGRALQCWMWLDYGGRLHAREHEHPKPLIPREQIKGVRGRINFLREEIVPLYKKEAERAVEELLDMGVDSICVCLLYAYLNPRHEKMVERIAKKIMKKKGVEIPIILSCEHNPVRGETPRLNSLVIEQYAVEPSRKQLINIANAIKEKGIPTPLRVLTSYGSTISPFHKSLIPTMVSGPIGGLIGCKFLAEKLGIKNLVSSDVGGTSFDVGLLMEKYVPTKWESSMGQFILNVPMISLNAIGAGTGMFLKYNEVSGRLEFGPESAGYRIGVSNEKSGVERVTITDCSLILGYLNPDNFLGGRIPLNKSRALKYIEKQIANPFNVDPFDAARGAIDLVEISMRNHLNSMIQGLGFRPENYTLISFGGGGPLHVAGYSRDMNFENVLIPEWAAAFSAFGCNCADHGYRYEKSVDLVIAPDGSLNKSVIMMLNATWSDLKKDIIKEFEREDRDSGDIEFKLSLRIQYLGMLDDLEVDSPSSNINEDDLKMITKNYNEFFERIFHKGTSSPELGYHIPKAIATGIVPLPKPKLPEYSIGSDTPDENALKEHREIYWDNSWHDARIWEMELLKSGNKINGPGVIEAPATTLLVPPGFTVDLDKHRIFQMKHVR